VRRWPVEHRSRLSVRREIRFRYRVNGAAPQSLHDQANEADEHHAAEKGSLNPDCAEER
jgi:hypothetical protein